MRRAAGRCALAALCVAAGAQAHHSFAMFDNSKTVTLTGTVYKFEWSNPHVWLWLSVPGAAGASTVWGLESGAPTQLKREGLKWDSFKSGDAITVTLRPMKNGEPGGRLMGATFADGRQFRSQDPNLFAAPPGTPAP
ncbi:MAG TPA: DUF6152 family protein [Steroidobacteraceae bacterium]|nr:DUF6152 family protein [Steroidobacteraceae bacterium]